MKRAPSSRGRYAAPRQGRLARNGLVRIAGDSRNVLGEDYRKLGSLVVVSFLMGLFEAGLVLIVVQMAVALAAERDVFDLHLGPLSATDLSLTVGVGAGVALVLLLVLCLVPVARLAGSLAAGAQHRTRTRLLTAYLQADWDVRSRYPEGHLQELLTTYTQRAERAVTQLVIASVALCGLTAILATAFLTSPVVAVVAIVCVTGVGSLLRPVMKLTRSASTSYAGSDRAFAGRMAEISRLTPEITAFDVIGPVEEAVGQRSQEVADSLRRLRTLGRTGASLYNYLALLLIVLAIGAVDLFADGDGLAAMGSVLLLLVRALAYGQQLQGQVQASNETAPFLETIEKELAVLRAAEVDRGGVEVGEPSPLVFHDVRFAYDTGNPVLRGVSFDIRAGESIGIVGPSGAGKSTLVQLLLRLRRPSSGTITAGGLPLDTIGLEHWYRSVAYVPQDNKLLSGTVADNIRFFRPGLGDAQVREAAQRAHLAAEIEALPDGYDTVIGPGARDLSGGQRQRLGIARALAGDPKLIILDEPTSALDARSEQLVAQTLADLRGRVTTVIVAHRPATTAICDRIFRIEGGQAVQVAAASAAEVLLRQSAD